MDGERGVPQGGLRGWSVEAALFGGGEPTGPYDFSKVESGGDQFSPTWSPDGRLIAFSSKHEDGIYQIDTVLPDGSKLARRTNGEMNKQSPGWIARDAVAATGR